MTERQVDAGQHWTQREELLIGGLNFGFEEDCVQDLFDQGFHCNENDHNGDRDGKAGGVRAGSVEVVGQSIAGESEEFAIEVGKEELDIVVADGETDLSGEADVAAEIVALSVDGSH